MSRKKRDRQRRDKKVAAARYRSVKEKVREVWPQLADALSNPAMRTELEKNGLVADMDAIRRLGEAGIFIAVASDGRARFHNIERE